MLLLFIKYFKDNLEKLMYNLGVREKMYFLRKGGRREDFVMTKSKKFIRLSVSLLLLVTMLITPFSLVFAVVIDSMSGDADQILFQQELSE